MVGTPVWNEDISRVPAWAYTRADIYRRELERLFYRGHWCYVGLEAEILKPGDFKRTKIGERSIIMTRDFDGGINVIENACAHRGVAFCQWVCRSAARPRERPVWCTARWPRRRRCPPARK